MEIAAKSISQHAPLLIGLLILAVIGLAVVCFRLSRRMQRMQVKWNLLLEGSTGTSLERLLQDHLTERRELMRAHDETVARVDMLEEKMDGSKRHLGIVRYDAFDDVGGAQSFALALYDDRGDGVVVSSLVGRADCRVYGKPLTRGRSERTLSQEEQRAIDEARRASPKPMIGP